MNLVCDGVSHCQYGEDEFNELCHTSTSQLTTATVNNVDSPTSVQLSQIFERPMAREAPYVPNLPSKTSGTKSITSIKTATLRELSITTKPLTLPPNAPPAVHLNPITENTKAREVSFLPFYPGGQEHDSTTQPASNFFSTDSSSLRQPKVKPSADFLQTTPGQTDSFGGISDQESAITSNLLTVPPNAAPAVHLNPITENTKAREVSFLPFYPGGREYESTTHVPKVISTKDNVKIVEELIRTTVKGTANQELQITSNPMTLPPNAPPAVHLNPITENTKAREVSFLPFYPGGQEHDSTTQPASNFFSTDSSSLRQPKVKPSADFLQTTPGQTDSIGGISDQESVITSNPLTIPPNAAPAVHLNPITENSREREISFSPFYPGAHKVDTSPQPVRGFDATDSLALEQLKIKSSTDSGNQDEENSSSTPSLQTTFPEFVVPSTVAARSKV